MRTITKNIYHFEELSDEAKGKASQWLIEGQDFSFEWDCLKDDAKNVNLKLNSWEYGRYCKGDFITSARECAEKVLIEHGPQCETYKTAKQFLSEYDKTEDEEVKENMEVDFLQSILEDYRILADNDYDNMSSEEYIKDMMEANEYEFDEEGNRV
jgi:hypothetical protein